METEKARERKTDAIIEIVLLQEHDSLVGAECFLWGRRGRGKIKVEKKVGRQMFSAGIISRESCTPLEGRVDNC
jgi:hypothetical protein